ncbi:HtaA domain-containing protein [Microbacterium sp. CIAB417]|uniref:HtaA domain-containing protein n=1 Tax=Microbacterium sp. CIAB417 TaxID=2860287 RepID=UPI001FAD3119|nr:HtaA domain-containing protein [Microbacterium sp. CIAB417]
MLFRSAVSAIALSAALLALPTPALGTERSAAAVDETCAVTGGSLTWGFKESFRSYISGTIAKGSWEPVDGASYTTPVFSWPATGGSVDPATGEGSVSFGGGVRFTGHNGLLDTTIAQPTLVIDSSGAHLLLDVSGLSMEDALAGATDRVHSAAQVDFVALDLAAAASTTTDTGISATEVPTAVTADGYAQFGNYETGTAFDPISFDVTFACVDPAPDPDVASAPEPTPAAETAAAETPAPVWLWGIGAAFAAVAAAATVIIARLRRRRGEDAS